MVGIIVWNIVIFTFCMTRCQTEKYQCCIDTVSSPDDEQIVAQNM